MAKKKPAKKRQSTLSREPLKDASHITPAMEAGVSDHIWSLREIINLLEIPAQAAA